MHVLIYDMLDIFEITFQDSGVKTPAILNSVSGSLAAETFHRGHMGPAQVEGRILMIVCEQELGKELRDGLPYALRGFHILLNDTLSFSDAVRQPAL